MQTTPSDHADDDRATQFLASTLTLLIVSWIIYGCRLYTRLRIVHRFFLEDYFITFAMVRIHPSTHTTDRTHQTRETQPNNVQASLTAFFATVPLQLSHGGGKHLTTLPQPPLSQTDRATRAEVLPIFYGRNTFLFRITPLVRSPLQSWLDVTGLAGGPFLARKTSPGEPRNGLSGLRSSARWRRRACACYILRIGVRQGWMCRCTLTG